MKKQFLAAFIPLVISVIAGASPLNSSALQGKYRLVSASGETAHWYCPDRAELKINAQFVGLAAETGDYRGAVYLAKDEGCSKGASDLSQNHKFCVEFNKTSVKWTSSQMTVFGYFRYAKGLQLNSNGDRLKFYYETSAYPLGAVVKNSDNFECIYERL